MTHAPPRKGARHEDPTRMLGDLAVSEIGYGTMSFASFYGKSPDRAEAIRVIRGAHEHGVTLSSR